MSPSFVAESIIYYICMVILSVKIYNCNLSKVRILLSFLVHIVFAVISSTLSKGVFAMVYVLTLTIQIVLLKVSIKEMRVKSLISVLLLLLSFNIIIVLSLTTFFPALKPYLQFVKLILCLCMFVACLIISYTKIGEKIKRILLFTSGSAKLLIVLLIVFSMIIITLVSDIQYYVEQNELVFVIRTTLILLVLLVCIAFPILIIISMSNTQLKKLTQSYEEQIQAQTEHYSALSEANFELRRFRHDFTNIQIGVSELIAEGKHTEAIDMLTCSNKEIYNTTNSLLMFDTGNGIVDALLGDKQQKAMSSNIKIVFEGAVPKSYISSTELCVIFGNTIDNAIEACQKLPEEVVKVIHISCKCNSGFMFLNITNPVVEPVIIRNNTFTTTKANKTLHGFGLYSLDKIISRHNGELKLSCDEQRFEVDISMCVENDAVAKGEA